MITDSLNKDARFNRSAIAAGVAAAVGATAPGMTFSAELEEVVVTARQRAESSQDIPIADSIDFIIGSSNSFC